jgi:hypothetical protein
MNIENELAQGITFESVHPDDETCYLYYCPRSGGMDQMAEYF